MATRAGGTMTWYLLVHQLPPRPLYLRAKVRKQLAKVGALALKNSVYVLPQRDDCLEDLQWIAQEATAGGGEAFVCRVAFLGGVSDDALAAEFGRRSGKAYEVLKSEIATALAVQPGRRGKRSRPEPPVMLARLRKRLDEVGAADFFGSPTRKEAEAMIRALETKVHGGLPRGPKPSRRTTLVGRTWVTRAHPKVDRLASAWLIRRFVDPGARFRFVSGERAILHPGEISFDMVGASFGHEGDRCTSETLLARLGLDEPALRAVTEIVHDIDLKDDKYGRPEVPGVRQLVEGLVRAHPDDDECLTRGMALFDDLYASFGGAAPVAPAAARRGDRRPGGRRARRSRSGHRR